MKPPIFNFDYISNIIERYRRKPRPQNVEKQIKRYRDEKDKEKRKIIYQYIILERKIAEGIKIFK